MKKFKKFLKILIIIVLVGIVSFGGFVWYKCSDYLKISKTRKAVLGNDFLKIVQVNYPAAEEYPTITMTGIKTPTRAVVQNKFVYSEEAKASDSMLKDGSTANYYVKDDKKQHAYNSIMIVNFEDKTFYVSDDAVSIMGIVDNLYPNNLDMLVLGEFEMRLREKFLYFTTILPMIMDMKNYVVDDNGMQAFVTEAERGSFTSAGDDMEYTLIRNYYNPDTMIIYKQTKVKPDGTERLLTTYEVTLDGITEADATYPDLTEYRQILQDK